MFFCMAACNPGASVCPSRQQSHRASLYAREGWRVCVCPLRLTPIRTGVICTRTQCSKQISSHRFHTAGFELGSDKGRGGGGSKNPTPGGTSHWQFVVLMQTGLISIKLHCHRTTCQDRVQFTHIL